MNEKNINNFFIMFNFRAVVEWFFKSFDISGATKYLKKLENEGVVYLMLVKKHWMYGILNSRRVLFVFFLVFGNFYLFVKKSTNELIGLTIGILLLINIFYWFYVIIIYLLRFYRIHGNRPYIEEVYSSVEKSNQGDIIFTKFFNHTIFLLITLFLLFILTVVRAVYGFFSGTEEIFYASLNAILILIQIGLFQGYLNRMINLEMDFNVILPPRKISNGLEIPGQVTFFDQKGLFAESQNMNSRKIKTISAYFKGFLGSFFNYGVILILSEGDSHERGKMEMIYIGDPKGTEKEIRKIIDNDMPMIELEVNNIIKKLFSDFSVEISTPESKEQLKKYLEENEKKVKEIYEKGDWQTKIDIKKMYILTH